MLFTEREALGGGALLRARDLALSDMLVREELRRRKDTEGYGSPSQDEEIGV